jgi:hypothetical protein
MKLSILCLVLVALGLSLSASSTATVQTTNARAALRVDDPPPEPVECPMCGGNAQVHARRLMVIQERMDIVALAATRW